MSAASEPLWLQIARKELGVAEIAGPESNPRIIEYHATTSYGAKDDSVSWCSAFVNWCMKQAGYQGTNNAGARSWANWGVALPTPVVGCVAVFGYPDSWRGHVGLYLGEDKESIRVFGGNQGDKVCEAYMSKKLLLGFRWPVGKPVAQTAGTASSPTLTTVAPASATLPPAIPADSVLIKKAKLAQIQADYSTIVAQVNALYEDMKGLGK